MSSSILTTIQNQLNNYGYPIFLVLGNIGNVFIIIIFGRQNKSPCAIYLISSAIVNIVYLTYNGFVQIFPFDSTVVTISAINFCKVNSFILNFLGQVSKTVLVLASFDRFIMTNENANIRAFSTPKRAKYLVFFSFIFWSIFSIHVPLMKTIANGQCTSMSMYSTILTIYTIVFVGLLPPVTMGIFGYLTYCHMRQRHSRVQLAGNNAANANNAMQQRDRYLLIIVMSEVIVYIVTTALFPVIVAEKLFTQYAMPNKSFQYFQNEIFALNLAFLLLYMNSATPFYIYLIASKAFRQDFKQLIMNSYYKLRGQAPVQNALTTTQAETKRETVV